MILWPTLPQPNPFLTELVDPNGSVGVEGMFCPGTDIDCIDKQWPESLAYFSWVHLERRHKAQRASR